MKPEQYVTAIVGDRLRLPKVDPNSFNFQPPDPAVRPAMTLPDGTLLVRESDARALTWSRIAVPAVMFAVGIAVGMALALVLKG